MGGYIIFIILLLISSYIKSDRSKLIFMFTIITIFSGIRYGIGYDYYSYLEGCLPDSRKPEGWEPIPSFFAILSSNSVPFLFFILSSIFISYFYYKGISKSGGDYLLEVFFYISFPFLFMNQLGIIRQGMASAIVFYVMTIPQSERLKRLLLLGMAFLCHYSAIISIFIFFPWQKISNRVLWIMLIISFSLSFLFVTIAEIFVSTGILGELGTTKAGNYLTSDSAVEGNFVKYLIYLIAVIVLVNYNRLVRLERNNAYLLGCLILGVSLYAIFSFNISLSKRFCMFFFSSSIILIPQLIKIYKIPRQVFVCICIILFSLTIFVGRNNTRDEDPPGYAVTYPYRTIFDIVR